jgi:hypothetical protein
MDAVEKLIIHAFLVGTVPIYSGESLVFDVFNSRALIFFNLDDPHEALSRIQFYKRKSSGIQEIIEQTDTAKWRGDGEVFFLGRDRW